MLAALDRLSSTGRHSWFTSIIMDYSDELTLLAIVYTYTRHKLVSLQHYTPALDLAMKLFNVQLFIQTQVWWNHWQFSGWHAGHLIQQPISIVSRDHRLVSYATIKTTS